MGLWGIKLKDLNKKIAEVEVHLKIVRVMDGVIIFSRSQTGTFAGTASDDELLIRAAREAVDKLSDEIVRINS